MKRAWSGVVVFIASLAPLPIGCAAFGEDPTPGTGTTNTPDGSTGQDGAVSGATDGPPTEDVADAAVPDGAVVDGSIASFGPICVVGDKTELEPNNDVVSATPFTAAFCGTTVSGDIDEFVIDLAGGAPFRVGWSRQGNVGLSIFGPGIDFAAGSISSGGFVEYDLSANPPGRYQFKVQTESATPQLYRLLLIRE